MSTDFDAKRFRKEYLRGKLLADDLRESPIEMLRHLLLEAEREKVSEPNLMVLSTAGDNGKVSSRCVLLKHLDDAGLVFFTNYTSRKSQQIAENSHVSATFYWSSMETQVNCEGVATKIPRQESESYYRERPRGAQLAAWASRQSAKVDSRQDLENAVLKMEKRFENSEVPCPPFWGGFRINPHRFEFWQGQKSRLHDRFVYEKVDGIWVISRLMP